MTIPGLIWAVSITAVCGAALWKGGSSERYAAAVFYVAWVATILVASRDRYATQWAVFIVDTVLLVLLAALVLRSDRYWPIFMTGFELLAVVTHAGRMVDQTMGAWAYLTAANIWAYLMLVALGWGVWTRWREASQPTSAAEPSVAPGATRR